jgi:large subunit GTPase 1
VFRCEDLEAYIRELRVGGVDEDDNDDGKGIRRSLLLVNKADLLTKKQRCVWFDILNDVACLATVLMGVSSDSYKTKHSQQWADYFDSQGVAFAFFSAAKATAEQEAEEKRRRKEMDEEDEEDRVVGSSEDEESEEEAVDKDSPVQQGEVDNLDEEDDEEDDEDEDETEELADRMNIALAASLEGGNERSTEVTIEEEAEVVHKKETEEQEAEITDDEDEDDEDEVTRILTVAELEELFERAAPPLQGEFSFNVVFPSRRR